MKKQWKWALITGGVFLSLFLLVEVVDVSVANRQQRVAEQTRISENSEIRCMASNYLAGEYVAITANEFHNSVQVYVDGLVYEDREGLYRESIVIQAIFVSKNDGSRPSGLTMHLKLFTRERAWFMERMYVKIGDGDPVLFTLSNRSIETGGLRLEGVTPSVHETVTIDDPIGEFISLLKQNVKNEPVRLRIMTSKQSYADAILSSKDCEHLKAIESVWLDVARNKTRLTPNRKESTE